MAYKNYGNKFSDIVSSLKRRQLLTGQPFSSGDISNIADPYFASARDTASTEAGLDLEGQKLDLSKSEFETSKSQFQEQLGESRRQSEASLKQQEDDAEKARRAQLLSTGVQGLGVGILGKSLLSTPTPATTPATLTPGMQAAPAPGTADVLTKETPWWSGTPAYGAPAAAGSGASLLTDVGAHVKAYGPYVAGYEGLRTAGKLGQQYELPGQTAWSALKQPATGWLKEGGKFLGISELGLPAEAEEKIVSTVEKPIEWGINKITCIIVTACTHRDSYEVGITREYRDKFMSPDELRGYYMMAERLVPVMQKYPAIKRIVKRFLVDPLISYGEHSLGYTDIKPSAYAVMVRVIFLTLCRKVGEGRESFQRANGEVY